MTNRPIFFLTHILLSICTLITEIKVLSMQAMCVQEALIRYKALMYFKHSTLKTEWLNYTVSDTVRMLNKCYDKQDFRYQNTNIIPKPNKIFVIFPY